MHDSNAVFPLDQLITVEQLAAKMRVSVKAVRSWVYKKIIPHTKFQRRIYFAANVVEEILAENAVASIRPGRLQSGTGRIAVQPEGVES